jgi:AraC family transcriptional regulator
VLSKFCGSMLRDLAARNAVDGLPTVLGTKSTRQGVIMISTERTIAWNLKPPPKLVCANNSLADGVDFREFRLEENGHFDWCCSVIQVVVALDSSARFRMSGRPGFEDPPLNGTTTIYLPGTPVRGEWEGTSSYLGTYLQPDSVERIFERTFPTMEFASGEFKSPIVENLLNAMRADVLQGSPGGPLFIQSVVISLLHHLHKSAEQLPLLAKGGLSRRQLNIIRDSIDANLAGKLSLDELAREVGVSPGYLSRAFKRSMGISPHQYILRVRVERAKRLIEGSECPLDVIAEQVGFADGSHMTTVFSKLTGRPPSQFRNR